VLKNFAGAKVKQSPLLCFTLSNI